VIAIALRLESLQFVADHGNEVLSFIIIFSLFKSSVLYFGGLYQRMWKHASIGELARIIYLGLLVTIFEYVIFLELYRQDILNFSIIPRSVPIIDGILTLFFVGGSRFSIRLSDKFLQISTYKEKRKPTLIIGAGQAGVMIVEEMQKNPKSVFIPIGFIDDDPEKLKLKIRGIKVLGNREKIQEVVTAFGVQNIIIAIPTASGNAVRELNEICKKTGVETKILPSMFEMFTGPVNVTKLRDVAIEDLLRRNPIPSDMKEVAQLVAHKKVLVTGGGGSIGSEICRQIAASNPAQLIILGHGENSIFKIAGELTKNYPDLKFSSIIADTRDDKRINRVFNRFKPDIVYHAAAHKHVPLMESNPVEAISNNIIGTYNVVKAALDHNTKKFVLISTDKAVNPTSVMGVTKRIAEYIIQDAAKTSGRDFIAVRFGNVLGSRGSVVPIFTEQILRGGPITITHPDVKRYFMTIPEAVHLVLQSSGIGKAGEIFVLDMGEPVKIVDLAKDLIRLSGHTSENDIEIVFTGLRPGEKLFEELVLDDESFEKTTLEKIFVLKNIKLNGKVWTNMKLENHLQNITPHIVAARSIVAKANYAELGQYLEELVPGFRYIGGVEAI
jgi:FlaA1/EpsC-like NDP-sugar epimerase